MDDDKTQATLRKAVEEVLDIEDEFAAEKLKVNTAINQRLNAARDKVRLKIAKLDITKESFNKAVLAHRHARSGVSVFAKIDDGEDLGLVGGFSRVMLATGVFFEPLYGAEEKKKMEGLVEELEASEEDQTNIVSMSEAAE